MPSWLDTGGSGKAFAPKTSSSGVVNSVISGASQVASKSGGSSGGGGSNTKNVVNSVVSGANRVGSQYTAPTLGNTWDADTDYQAIINNAVNNNDYVTAAKAEQLRNQKIIDSGMSQYDTTDNYSGHLNNGGSAYTPSGGYTAAGTHNDKDLPTNSLAIIQMCKEGYNKAIAEGNTSLAAYYHATAEAERGKYGYTGGIDGSQYIQLPNDFTAEDIVSWDERYDNTNPREEYNGKYDPQIDALLKQILNRDDFSYDPMNDPLYQQYQQQYRREGDRAMRDTLAEVAAGAGGMNSYAITAAQQANDYYNQQMADKIPELYQLAYQMYLNDKESKVQDLGILQNMDATQYGRYRDTINDWYKDKDFAFGAYKTAVDQNNWQTNFDYNSMWDNKIFDNDNFWKDKEFTLSQNEIDYNKSKQDRDDARALIQWYIENGATSINPELLAQANMTQAEVESVIASIAAEKAKKGSSGKGKGGGIDWGDDLTGDENDSPTENPTDENTTTVGKDVYPQIQDNVNSLIAVTEACRQVMNEKGKETAIQWLNDMRKSGEITSGESTLILRELGILSL